VNSGRAVPDEGQVRLKCYPPEKEAFINNDSENNNSGKSTGMKKPVSIFLKHLFLIKATYWETNVSQVRRPVPPK
jgi:hypothetical protein